ncbi:MAG: class II aldolase/adducin family protein [Candidatus Poribacteria bacterium]
MMLAELVRIAHEYGSDIKQIQGAGGNFSIKQGTELTIKSSGVLLKNVTQKRGWTEVDSKRFLEGIPKIHDRYPTKHEESCYIHAVGDSQIDTNVPRPSMELGFHAVIPHRWVLHTHSLAGILFGLQNSGLPDHIGPIRMISIPPAIPGLHLTWMIQQRLQDPFDYDVPCFWLLKNHGVVWSGNQLDMLEKLSCNFEIYFRAVFGIDRFQLPTWLEKDPAVLGFGLEAGSVILGDEPTYPDYVVFFPRGGPKQEDPFKIRLPRVPKEDEKDIFCELVFAQTVVSTIAQKLGVESALPVGLRKRIASLEIEKLRLLQMRW